MNSIRNHVQLIGYLGKDTEIKEFPNGKVRASTSIATNEIYKNAEGEQVTKTEWHNLSSWGKTAELMEKLCKKGKEVAILGKIQNNNYEDKEGNTRNFSEIIVSQFLLLGKPEKAA